MTLEYFIKTFYPVGPNTQYDEINKAMRDLMPHLFPAEPRKLTDIEKNLEIDVAKIATEAVQRFMESLAKELGVTKKELRELINGC